MTVKELIAELLEYPGGLPVMVEITSYDRCGDSYNELEEVSCLAPKRMPADERGEITSLQSYAAKEDMEHPNVLVIE